MKNDRLFRILVCYLIAPITAAMITYCLLHYFLLFILLHHGTH